MSSKQFLQTKTHVICMSLPVFTPAANSLFCSDQHDPGREGQIQSVPLRQHRRGEVSGAQLRAEPR